ncbi:MAG: hypothetical protein MJ005_05385 [Methanocorpusculum sp.]|nr:hypothetical protein [Methanocorpusculum sp.]HJJ44856.1 hypothetical protein [Methanocorpusculum sp.]
MSTEFDTSKNGLALGSFVAALVALILKVLFYVILAMGDGVPGTIFSIVAWIAMIVAVVLGAIALKKKIGIKALAVAGFVIGIVLLAITIIAILILLAFGIGLVVGGVGGAFGGVSAVIDALGVIPA